MYSASSSQRRYALYALFAAVLFGASAPGAKLLLGDVQPLSLAALLYIGCGLSVLGYRVAQHMASPARQREAGLARNDMPWLVGAVLAGGVAAPILLLLGLEATPAATASLLLNFEAVATALIAVVVFREAVGGRVVVSLALVTLAAILLTLNPAGEWGLSLGALAILGACALWGLDNNLTRNISAKDPLQIVLVKGLGAGAISLILAMLLDQSLPALPVIAAGMALGALSYGLSIVLYIRSLRGLGAARAGALFGTAPIAGVLISFIVFRELPEPAFLVALALSVVAIVLLLRESHEHAHVHEPGTHDHQHRHDDGHHNHGHHNHDHSDMTDRSYTHSHAHTHEWLEHAHAHAPDIHHRHAH